MAKGTFNISYAPAPGAYLNQSLKGEVAIHKQLGAPSWPLQGALSGKILLTGAGILRTPHSVLR